LPRAKMEPKPLPRKTVSAFNSSPRVDENIKTQNA